MIQLFRKFFASKLGIALTLAFLVVIGLAFAMSDVMRTGTGNVAAGDRVALVGSERIAAEDLIASANNGLAQARQQEPRLTMPAYVAQGGFDNALNQLLDRVTLFAYGKQIGLRASDRLVDSELLKIQSFRGPDGNFNRQAFLAAIGQQGFTEAQVRQDIAMTLVARQIAAPALVAPGVPSGYGPTYAALLRETRSGAIARIPSSAFAPTAAPSDSELQAWYTAHRTDFIRPERRVIRYVAFGSEVLKNVPAPSDAQIAARYQRDRAKFAASDRRDFTQVVASSQAVAQQIVADVRAGKSLDDAARARGLATSKVENHTQAELTSAASGAVAQAAFATAAGQVSAPARGGLGWYVLRLDKVTKKPEQTLAQVRDQIVTELKTELQRAAISDLTAQIEEQFDKGSSLTDVAQEHGLTVATTEPATADGAIYGKPGQRLPQALASVVATAFEMDEGEPQLAETVPGQSFVMFDVKEVTASAPAPLAEIRDDVIARWKLDKGAVQAKAAAERIVARVGKGMPLAEAVRAEGVTLPAPEPLSLGREQLARLPRVPAPLALLFSMAANSVKPLQDGNLQGWFVVRLDKIDAKPVPDADPLVAATLRQLGQVYGDELTAQFVAAARREVKVERNDVAIAAVRARLAGTAEN